MLAQPVFAAPDRQRHVSVFYPDLHTAKVDEVIAALRTARADIIHTTLPWSQVEKVRGKRSFDEFRGPFERLKREGAKFIIALDTSGRLVVPPSRILVTPGPNQTARPNWLTDVFGTDVLQSDFFGGVTSELDPFDERHRAEQLAFYSDALKFMRSTLGESVFAVLPGITSELEIKFGQVGFKWRSWSEAARRKFMQRTGYDMPVTAYNNILAGFSAQVEPHFYALQRFREETIVDYLAPLCASIKQAGFKRIGYFGQPFTSLDAVYAVGVVEKCTELFDIAAADFNYYDGYQQDPDPWVVPAFINFLQNLGYKETKLGLYVERYKNFQTNEFDPTVMPVVADTLAYTADTPAVTSMEIGGFEPKDFGHIASVVEPNTFRIGTKLPAKKPDAQSVGVVASFDNHYLWHGDHSNDRDILNDALNETFRLLSLSPSFKPDMISARRLEDGRVDVAKFKVLFFPLVTVMSDGLLRVLAGLKADGTKLAQDAAAGVFKPNGESRPLDQLGVFDITGMGWEPKGVGSFKRGGQTVQVDGGRQYFSHIRLSNASGEVRMPSAADAREGLILRSPQTLAFGFTPQLCESGPGKAYWEDVFLKELEDFAR